MGWLGLTCPDFQSHSVPVSQAINISGRFLLWWWWGRNGKRILHGSSTGQKLWIFWWLVREINTNWAVNFLLLRMTCKKDSPIVMFVCYFSGLVGNVIRIRSISIINLTVVGSIKKVSCTTCLRIWLSTVVRNIRYKPPSPNHNYLCSSRMLNIKSDHKGSSKDHLHRLSFCVCDEVQPHWVLIWNVTTYNARQAVYLRTTHVHNNNNSHLTKECWSGPINDRGLLAGIE